MSVRFPLLLRLAAAAGIALAPLAAPLAARAQVSDRACTVDETELALNDAEQQMLTVINNYRTQHGQGTLEVSTTLTKAALWKSAARANGAPENHDDEDRTWDQRLVHCGYNEFALMGENMGRVGGAPPNEIEGLLDAWKSSVIHNDVLLTDGFRAIGLARVVGGDGVAYWTTVFGSMTDEDLAPPPPSAAEPPPPVEEPPPPPAEEPPAVIEERQR